MSYVHIKYKPDGKWEPDSDHRDEDSAVLDMIIDDLERDAKALDGRPFNAKTVAEIFGTLMATTQAIAKVVRQHLGATMSNPIDVNLSDSEPAAPLVDEVCIAVIEDDGGYEAPREQREANGALLAAAPDLLAACKQVAAWLSSFSMPPTSTISEKHHHLAILEAAVSKAEGKEQP